MNILNNNKTRVLIIFYIILLSNISIYSQTVYQTNDSYQPSNNTERQMLRPINQSTSQAIIKSSKMPAGEIKEINNLIKNEEYENAMKKLNEKANQYYSDTRPLIMRASLLSRLGDYHTALEDLNIALKMEYNQGEIYYEQGLNYQYLSEYKKANDSYTNAIKYNYKKSAVYLKRSQVRKELKDYQGSLADLKKLD